MPSTSTTRLWHSTRLDESTEDRQETLHEDAAGPHRHVQAGRHRSRQARISRRHGRIDHHRPRHRLAVDDADRRRDGAPPQHHDPRRGPRRARHGGRPGQGRGAPPSGAVMETKLAMLMYQEYTTFFQKSERERRWNPFDDIPWDKINKSASEELALCAETFCGVEMYLPDYVAGGINVG